MASRNWPGNERAFGSQNDGVSAMVFKVLMTGVLVTLPVTVSAQAGPVAEKSPAQIVCEINGDCDSAFDQADANVRTGKTRGFRFDVPVKAAKPQVPAASGYVPPKPSVPAQPGRATPAKVVHAARPAGSSLSINFMTGSSAIAPGSVSQAKSLVAALQNPQLAGKKFIVGGHTDSVGNREYNLELSRKRAEALVDFMVQNGVERSRLQPEGYGFDRPIPGLGSKAAANRRVEIVKID